MLESGPPKKMPRNLARCAAVTLAFAGLTALLAPAGPARGQETPRRGGTMIVGMESEPTTLNGAVQTGTPVSTLTGHIFDQLVELDLNFTIKPRLAEKWETSPDGKTYTFRIFKNATWHDGKPVTSEDVKWTLGEVVPKFHPFLRQLFRDSLEGIQTPDRNTAMVRLRTPFAPLLVILAASGGPTILPKHVYGDGRDLKQHPANLRPIGSGPFKFKEWVKGNHITLERHEKYHRPGIPYLDGVIFQFLPDANGRWLALEKGEVDYLNYYIMPLHQVARAKGNPNLVVDARGGEGPGALEAMIFNTRKAPLSRPEVRQALAHAIDKKALVDRAYLGLAKPARSIMGSGIKPFFNPNVPAYDYNVQKANQLLDAAGYPRKADGRRFSMKLLWTTEREAEMAMAEQIRDQFRQIGVQLEFQRTDRPTALDQVYVQWTFDAALWLLGTGPDPTQQITRSYHTRQIQKVPLTNGAGYSSKEADALFDAEFKQVDPAERVRMWHRIQEIIMRDVPVLPLVEIPVVNVYTKRFRNVITTPQQNVPYVGNAWSTQGAGS